MAAREDVLSTFELIRNFWPDLEFTKEDLLSGSCDFVVKFYRNFINEINDKVAFLINEEIPDDEIEGVQNFDPIVELYCKVAKILTKMKYSYLTLSDFLNRNPKRTHAHVKFSIHFLIYVNNILDELSVIANESNKQLMEVQDMRLLKEDLLQEVGELSRKLGEHRAIAEQLDSKLKEVNHQYEQMLADRAVNDKELAAKMRELELLQNESDNADYEVKFLDEQEANLKGCIITDEEFAKLKNTRRNLQDELERLSAADCTSAEKVDTEFERVQQLTKYGAMLQDLNFEHLYVATAADLREENQLDLKITEELKNDLDQDNNSKRKEAAELKVLKRQLEEIEGLCNELKKSVLVADEKYKEEYEHKLTEVGAHFEKSQKIKTEISHLKMETEAIEKDKKKLNSVVAQEYDKILKTDRGCTDTFYNWLSDINVNVL